MCLLIYTRPDAEVPVSDLAVASINNPDGFGFALRTPDARMIIGHSMLIEDAMDMYYDAIDKNPGSETMFHLRFATHGVEDVENCHPFKMGGNDDRVVLGHNGILPVDVSKNERRSDTRIFAEDHLRAYVHGGHLNSPKLQRQLSHAIRGSKLVLLSTHPHLKRSSYIFNEEDGHWDDGVWYSNYSYVESAWMAHDLKKMGFTPSDWEGDDYLDNLCDMNPVAPRETRYDWTRCLVCNLEWMWREDEPMSHCEDCGACFECGSWECNHMHLNHSGIALRT